MQRIFETIDNGTATSVLLVLCAFLAIAILIYMGAKAFDLDSARSEMPITYDRREPASFGLWVMAIVTVLFLAVFASIFFIQF